MPHPNCDGVSKKEPLAPPTPPPPQSGERWTKPEDYLDLGRLWRRSAARLRRRLEPRTEPERPRFMLGMLPFMLLILALMAVAVFIIVAAVPGRGYEPQRPTETEEGTAAPGWLER